MIQRQRRWASIEKSDWTSLRKPFDHYKGGKEMPLAGYASLIGIFGVALTGVLLATRGGKEPVYRGPARARVSDLLLMGVATHKLSRFISKDRVTSPLRAPFTEYEGPASASEVNERSRGTGLQRALGDLLICPFCMGPWVATALAFGFRKRPRMMRLVSGIFAAVTLSDFLHYAFSAVQKVEK